MSDYHWDIFLSYPRAAPVGTWVEESFFPLLSQWLPQSLPPQSEGSIFLDTRIEVGSRWPDELCDSLLRSRIFVPVWSPSYFRSPWCQSEWRSFKQRQDMLGCIIIYPIRFADGRHYPMEAQAIQQCLDVRDGLNLTGSAFRESQNYLSLQQKVQTLAEELSDLILAAPPWQQDWPKVQVDANTLLPTTNAMSVPRLL